jgi:hypothetical protein
MKDGDLRYRVQIEWSDSSKPESVYLFLTLYEAKHFIQLQWNDTKNSYLDRVARANNSWRFSWLSDEDFDQKIIAHREQLIENQKAFASGNKS